MADSDDTALLRRDGAAPVADSALPVVARLVVEIRSDGSRTIARGALEDFTTEQRVAIEAEGASPLSLAIALARSLTSVPALAARRLAGGRRRGLRHALRGALLGRRGDDSR